MNDFAFKSKSAPKRTVHEDGTWAEGKVREWLEAMSSRNLDFAYHRYPDTKAAQLMKLQAQPSDYLASWKRRGVWHIEVKETAQERRLPRAKISQYGKLLMFQHAGIEALVIVYRSAFKDWYLLTPEDLFASEEPPASFAFDPERRTYATAGYALASRIK